MFKRNDGRWCEKIWDRGITVYIYANTKQELKKKIKEHIHKQETGELFSVIASDWREEHYKTLTSNSKKPYNGAYNRAIQYLGQKHINEIKREDILKIIKAMEQKDFAKKTVSTQILVLNLIFKYAILNGFTDFNPCDLVKTPKNLKKTKREMPSEKDLKNIIDNVDSDPFGLFAYFLYFTGCRFGEALAVQGKDIDFQNNKIHISKSIYYDNGTQVGKPKTDAGDRLVPLVNCLREKIPSLQEDQYLFSYLEDRSKPFTQKRIFTQWKKYQERVGITCTPHQLRHGFATLLFEAGLTAKDAQPILGHATLEMTADVYTHITSKRSTENADKLNNFINQIISKI